MRSIKTITLGCKVNQYETEYVRQGFERLGYRSAAEGQPVDLCVVNTCTVTAESEAKSRKIIRRFAKRHPEAEIIVMGCYAARAAEEVAALPGVVEVVADKRELSALLVRRGLANPPTGIEGYFQNRRRAYVKVQDGCDQHCAYCIVPTVRPHLASRAVEEILAEVRRLVARGHHEIVLTGIHLGHFGREERGEKVVSGQWPVASEKNLPSPLSPLPSLLRQIAALPGDFRVRLSSIEAAEVTPELLRVMAEHPNRICPHLHVPLQSGSDAILERMNRRWPAGKFIEKCREIRAALDNPALTTDVIVGFPGESQADFEATRRAVEEIGFAKTHVFRFSPREGTPAADMTGQVTNRTVQERAAELEKLNRELQEAYLRTLLGRRLRVLVESPIAGREGWMCGACDRYAPAATPGGRELIGRFVTVAAERLENGVIF